MPPGIQTRVQDSEVLRGAARFRQRRRDSMDELGTSYLPLRSNQQTTSLTLCRSQSRSMKIFSRPSLLDARSFLSRVMSTKM